MLQLNMFFFSFIVDIYLDNGLYLYFQYFRVKFVVVDVKLEFIFLFQ